MKYFLKITKAYGSTSRWLHAKTALCAFTLHSLVIALLLLVFAGPARATIIINAPMTDTNGTGWTMGGAPGATLTGNGTIDPVGNGWLRLTDNNGAGNETGFAYNNTSFDLSQGLLIEFDYATWGGTGADGYSVYLFDAGATFNPGAYGGSLGYAQKGIMATGQGGSCSSYGGTAIPGMNGGYIGIGVDEYGNFSDCGEGRYLGWGGNSGNVQQNTVTIRGPVIGFGGGASGQVQNSQSYPWIATSGNYGSLWYAGTPRPAQTGTNYRHVRIQISPAPNPVANVWVAFGYNSPLVFTQMITNQALPAISTSQLLKIGYAASTGGSTNYHEIRNLIVSNQNTASAIDLAITDAFLDITSGSTTTAGAGDQVRYTVVASNTGPNNVTATGVGIQDTIPAAISGVNWTCTGSGGATCGAASGSGNTLNTIANLPRYGYVTYTITATVSDPSPTDLLSNTASLVIPGSVTDYNSNNDSDTSNIPVASDLSTSDKNWSDPNGGDQNPGDVIPYTITLRETANAPVSGVMVTDTFDPALTNLSVTSCPSGAICLISGQTLTVTDVSVPAGGTTSIVVSTTIAGGTAAGTTIDNIATITNPTGPGATAIANTITVSQSQIVVTGSKPLYFYGGTSSPYDMSRTMPAVNATNTTAVSVSNNGSVIWSLQTQPLARDFIITGSAPLTLYMRGSRNQTYSIRATLDCSQSWGASAFIGNTSVALSTTTTRTAQVNMASTAAPLTCPAGQYLTITILNNNSGRTFQVYPVAASLSYVSKAVLPTSTVISVDSMNVYSAVSPSTAQSPGNNYVPGSTVYLRPVVSDPFGAFDISSVAITIRDPSYSPALVSDVTLTNIVSSTSGTNTYQYQYTVPSSGATGTWTYSVVAKEGSENTISDYGAGTFRVYHPNLLVVKSATVWSDPVSGTTATANPKAIPGAVMSYTILVTNSDPLPADNVTITDSLNTEITAGHLAFRTQYIDGSYSCPAGSGTVVNGACKTNANDADQTDWNITTGNTVTVTGLSIASGGSVTVKFQVIIQ